jgi:hypothetical protein
MTTIILSIWMRANSRWKQWRGAEMNYDIGGASPPEFNLSHTGEVSEPADNPMRSKAISL